MEFILDHAGISVQSRAEAIFGAYGVDLLPRLGFRQDDATELLFGLAELSDSDWDHIEDLRRELTMRVGRIEDRDARFGTPSAHGVAVGYPELLALAAVAPSVHDELVRRGLDDETAWKSVSDLGQQVHVHRLVHGEFGFSANEWVAGNFNGSLVWLDRLQFTVERDPQLGWVLGTHIPETGPLTPASVEAAIRRASLELVAAYPEYHFSGITCTSWLLDPNVAARLSHGSNVATFARRFIPYGEPRPGRRDALFFGFHRETDGGIAVDLDELTPFSSLQRALLDQLRTDEGVVIQSGWIPLPLHDWAQR